MSARKRPSKEVQRAAKRIGISATTLDALRRGELEFVDADDMAKLDLASQEVGGRELADKLWAAVGKMEKIPKRKP